MAEIPTTVRMPISIPLYMKTGFGDFVEVCVIEQMIDVTVEVSL